MKNKLLILTVIVFALLAGCKKKTGTSAVEAVDSLSIKFTALVDSVNSNWHVMIADDDEKHMLMKRLLLEVSYTNNYDKAKFDELNNQVDALNTMRYDQKTMRSSELIDAYDSATWAVADNIILFARNHPRYQDIPLMEELINDITGKNNFVLIHRIHYDNAAKELNAFIDQYGTMVKETLPKTLEAPLPLFELPS